jgi:hypothetical protein
LCTFGRWHGLWRSGGVERFVRKNTVADKDSGAFLPRDVGKASTIVNFRLDDNYQTRLLLTHLAPTMLCIAIGGIVKLPRLVVLRQIRQALRTIAQSAQLNPRESYLCQILTDFTAFNACHTVVTSVHACCGWSDESSRR